MHLASATRKLRSGSGALIVLGERLGGGGEGTVYTVQGRPAAVAKIYKAGLSREKEQKLQAMISAGTASLASVTAWPSDILASDGHLVGFLMPRATQAEEAHILYGPKSRKQKFPSAGYKFLVHAAMNIARAFATVHQHGIIVGDVNERLAMIAQDGTVRLIDCDSFQIVSGRKKFLCEVGVPTFTPPELQGVPTFRGVERREQHDVFGLAVLVFHLLFLGKHPFSGRHRTVPDTTIEMAIREHRFAYSPDRNRTLMDAPPAAPSLSSAGQTIASLFEQAFSPAATSGGVKRPSAAQWADALQELLLKLLECKENAAHAYVSSVGTCPWCAIDAHLRSELFNYVEPAGLAAQRIDVDAIWRAIEGTSSLVLKPLPDPKRIALPLGPSADVLSLTKACAEQERVRDAAQARVAAEHDVHIQEQLLHKAEVARTKANVFFELFDDDRARLSLSERQCTQAKSLLVQYMRMQNVLPWILTLSVIGSFAIDQLRSMSVSITFLACCALTIAWYFRRVKESKVKQLAQDASALRRSVELGPEYRRQKTMTAELEVQSAKRGLQKAQAKAYQAMVAENEAKAQVTVSISKGDVLRAAAAIESRRSAASARHSEVAARYQALRGELVRLRPEVERLKDQAKNACEQIRQIEARRTAERWKAREEALEGQRNNYLDQFFIAREKWTRIPKTVVAALSSYGIETAADIEWDAVKNVPGFGDVRTRTLMEWRRQKETAFKFDASRSDGAIRVQAVDRRLNGERRLHERLLMKLKSHLDSLAAPLAHRLTEIEKVWEHATCEVVQAQVDFRVIESTKLATDWQGTGSSGFGQKVKNVRSSTKYWRRRHSR